MKYPQVLGSVLVVTALLAYMLSLAPITNAQGLGALIVRPAKVEIEVAPGENKETEISVTNTTPAPLSISIRFEDVSPNMVSGSAGEIATLLGTSSGAYPLKGDLHTTTPTIDLLSGQTAKIPVTVSIGKEERPGGRYGSVVLMAKPSVDLSTPANQNISLETRIAVLYFVKVAGQVEESGTLERFSLFNDARYVGTPSENSPVMFQVAFTNSGNVHLDPYGKISIAGLFGRPKDIVLEPWVVYPKVTRENDVAFIENLFPGYYRATIDLNRGYGNVIDTKTVWFIVVPSPSGWAILVIALVISFPVLRRSLRISRNFTSS